MSKEPGDDLREFLGDTSLYEEVNISRGDRNISGDEDIGGRRGDEGMIATEDLRQYIEENVIELLDLIERNQATEEDIDNLQEAINTLDIASTEDLETIERAVERNEQNLELLGEAYTGLSEAFERLDRRDDELREIADDLEDTLTNHEEVISDLTDAIDDIPDTIDIEGEFPDDYARRGDVPGEGAIRTIIRTELGRYDPDTLDEGDVRTLVDDALNDYDFDAHTLDQREITDAVTIALRTYDVSTLNEDDVERAVEDALDDYDLDGSDSEGISRRQLLGYGAVTAVGAGVISAGLMAPWNAIFSTIGGYLAGQDDIDRDRDSAVNGAGEIREVENVGTDSFAEAYQTLDSSSRSELLTEKQFNQLTNGETDDTEIESVNIVYLPDSDPYNSQVEFELRYPDGSTEMSRKEVRDDVAEKLYDEVR